MNTKTIKTSDLIGPALDWAVAKCENTPGGVSRHCCYTWDVEGRVDYEPSSNWADGGPIIERENIELRPLCPGTWRAIDMMGYWWNGPTPLIAAMRCYVASKLGDEVDVPEELT